MLSVADAAVARRDPALPGLATVLDPDAVGAALGRGARGVRITYVRYKPGTSCAVGYQFHTDSGPADAVARAYRPDAADKLGKAAGHPGRVVLRDRGIVLAFFPDDDRLSALPRLADDEGRRDFLQKLLPARPDLWDATLSALRYKPGRRYVGQLSVGGRPVAALKVYAPAGYEAAQANAKAVRSCAAFTRPRRLGRSARHAALALEWLPGRLLTDVLADANLDTAAVGRVGEALAALHAQAPERFAPRSRAEEAAVLPPLAGWIGHVCPHLAVRARRLAVRVAASLAELRPAARPVHGDFYAKQLLIADDGVGLLDFDEAYRGDPAADLGLFVAHLWRDEGRGTLTAGRVVEVRDALLARYGDVPPTVPLYTAAGLLRLAPHPFRSREPDWPDRTAALLGRAEAELRAYAGYAVAANGGGS